MISAGVWDYTLINGHGTVQALNVGSTLADSFTVTTVDGTARTINITINGANDEAVITGLMSGTVTEAGGVSNGVPGTPTASGALTSVDIDNASTFTVVSTGTASIGGYGIYTITDGGIWTYTLDDANSTVQALNAGSSLADSFTVTTVDGTARAINITINGANDTPVGNNDSASATEKSGPDNDSGGANGTGNVLTNDTDADNGSRTVTAIRLGNNEGSGTAGTVGSAIITSRGTLTLGSDGSYTYVVNENNAEV